MALYEPLQCDSPEQRATPLWLHPFAAAMASAAGALAATFLLRSSALPAPLRLAVVALGVLPSAWLVYAMWRWVRGLDEMHRKIQAEALALAFPAAMLLALAVQFLQRAGWVQGVGIEDAWETMAILYVAALFVTLRRYR